MVSRGYDSITANQEASQPPAASSTQQLPSRARAMRHIFQPLAAALRTTDATRTQGMGKAERPGTPTP